MGVPGAQIRAFRSQLRYLERIVGGHSKRCCSQVSQAQCHVLLQVDDLRECTLKDLAATLDLDTSTISRTVDRLVKMGLLIRTENPADRRYNILSTTRKGGDLCKTIHADADKYFGQVLENIPRGKRNSVIDSFQLIVKSLIQVERNTENTSACCDCKAG